MSLILVINEQGAFSSTSTINNKGFLLRTLDKTSLYIIIRLLGYRDFLNTRINLFLQCFYKIVISTCLLFFIFYVAPQKITIMQFL